MKIVWEACSAAGAVLGTFAYPDKVAAEAKVAMLTRSTVRTHVLRETKVPDGLIPPAVDRGRSRVRRSAAYTSGAPL
jgi:hypothetical protein